MNKTSIEWTDYTWNPVTGCHKVSRGCKHCYAETLTKRFGKHWGVESFRQIVCHQDRLMEPVHIEHKLRGKKVFVCDMSDLFHEDVPDQFIFDVFETIWNCPMTTFQILTKRPDRALKIMNQVGDKILVAMPLTNVWIGVSCEDQKTADERIPLLLQIPAAVRFLSCEPLLGPIDICQSVRLFMFKTYGSFHTTFFGDKLHWVIVGGESGHGAEPMHPDWVRSLRDECKTADVSFFFKQWGEYLPYEPVQAPFYRNAATGEEHDGHGMDHLDPEDSMNAGRWNGHRWYDPMDSAVLCIENDSQQCTWLRVGKSKSGNLLDGRQHLEFPKPQIIA